MDKLYYIKKTDGCRDTLTPKRIYEIVYFETTYYRDWSIEVGELVRLTNSFNFPADISDKLKNLILKHFSDILLKRNPKLLNKKDLELIFQCYNSCPSSEVFEEAKESFLRAYLESFHDKDTFQDWDDEKISELKDRRLNYPEIEAVLKEDITNKKSLKKAKKNKRE